MLGHHAKPCSCAFLSAHGIGKIDRSVEGSVRPRNGSWTGVATELPRHPDPQHGPLCSGRSIYPQKCARASESGVHTVGKQLGTENIITDHCWRLFVARPLSRYTRKAGQECPASFGLPVGRRPFDRRAVLTLFEWRAVTPGRLFRARPAVAPTKQTGQECPASFDSRISSVSGVAGP